MDEKELIQRAEKAAGWLHGKAHSFDVFVKESASTSVEVREQKLDAYEESRTWGVGVRVLQPDGRVGFAYSTGSDDAPETAAAMALENSTSAEPDENNIIPQPPYSAYPEAGEYDPEINSISEQDKISRALRLEKAALDFDPRVKRVRKSSASFTESSWALLNSMGIKASASGTYFSCGIMTVAEEAGDSQMGYDFDYRRNASLIDFEEVGRRASDEAVRMLGAKKTPSGLFPVLLENVVATDFLGLISASFSAEALIKGRSLLADKLDKVIFAPSISIFDDGLMAGGLASRPFDDEGVPSQKTALVSEGRFLSFLHSTHTAKKTGMKPTGNASRGGFRSQPSVGSTNLYIQGGCVSKDALIGSIKSGLMVQSVLGMHTANPVSGDFSVGISGQWIEDGKVAYPVREGAISGNILDLFSGIDALANDLRFVGRVGSPSIL
ncbi:MAG TPA: TldD/PmbA family protein, partial [Nitrospirota bacterium]